MEYFNLATAWVGERTASWLPGEWVNTVTVLGLALILLLSLNLARFVFSIFIERRRRGNRLKQIRARYGASHLPMNTPRSESPGRGGSSRLAIAVSGVLFLILGLLSFTAA